MLDMGFYDDIMKIISFMPSERQNLLFSATMPTKIRDLARKILHEPVEINIALSKPPAVLNRMHLSSTKRRRSRSSNGCSNHAT